MRGANSDLCCGRARAPPAPPQAHTASSGTILGFSIASRFLCGGQAPGPRWRAGGLSLAACHLCCPGFTNADFLWNGAVACNRRPPCALASAVFTGYCIWMRFAMSACISLLVGNCGVNVSCLTTGELATALPEDVPTQLSFLCSVLPTKGF